MLKGDSRVWQHTGSQCAVIFIQHNKNPSQLKYSLAVCFYCHPISHTSRQREGERENEINSDASNESSLARSRYGVLIIMGCAKFKEQRQCRQTQQMNITISFRMNFCLIHRLNCARTTTHCHINTEIHLILLHIFCSVFHFNAMRSVTFGCCLVVTFQAQFLPDQYHLISRKCYSNIFSFRRLCTSSLLVLCCHPQVSSRFCVIII